MKNTVFSTIALLAFCFQLNAQPAGALWAGSRSGNANANAVHTAISKAYDAFMPGGNVETGWAAYTDEAAEIGPDGSITFGKKALREAWDGFMKMADEAPKFKYENVQVRMLTSDVALAVWDSEADIKIGGQQMGGKAKGMAVLRKINGAWKLEFDSVTPVMPIPGAGN
ncbi:MAG: nuclear transport factor 2 family protein [Saprospiraceae bacterium]|nr:nuclear transport factor 2 family protein [Saprospiraceae bacterium]